MATEIDDTDAEAQIIDQHDRSDAFDNKIEDAKIEGWSVSKDQGERVVLKKSNYGSFGGHVLMALLTVWWTLGLGNVCYAAYKYWSDSDTRVIRAEGGD